MTEENKFMDELHDIVVQMRNKSTELELTDEQYITYIFTEIANIAHYTALSGQCDNEVKYDFGDDLITISTKVDLAGKAEDSGE